MNRTETKRNEKDCRTKKHRMKQVKTQNKVTKGWKVLLNRYKKYKTRKKICRNRKSLDDKRLTKMKTKKVHPIYHLATDL